MEIDAEEAERLAPIELRYQTPEPVVVERHLAIRFTMEETDTVRRTMMEYRDRVWLRDVSTSGGLRD
jgi:hypothetical protein